MLRNYGNCRSIIIKINAGVCVCVCGKGEGVLAGERGREGRVGATVSVLAATKVKAIVGPALWEAWALSVAHYAKPPRLCHLAYI